MTTAGHGAILIGTMPTINVNHGAVVFSAQAGVTLLDALKAQGIYLRSACGGRGICGQCKVRVPDMSQEPSPVERTALTEGDVRLNMRLACQIRLAADLNVEVPAALLSVQQYRGLVESTVDLSPDMRHYRVALLDPPRIEFAPGQYIQLHVPIEGQDPYGPAARAASRSYSIASPPSEADAIELIVRRMAAGRVSHWIFDNLRPGSEVTFSGPLGEFRLSHTHRPMIWVAAGSGIAPFWSMLRHMQGQSIHRPTQFFYGAAKPEGLVLQEQMLALQRQLPGFEYVPVLSHLSQELERRLGNLRDHEAYICGPPGMVGTAMKVLIAKGVSEHRLFYDRFA